MGKAIAVDRGVGGGRIGAARDRIARQNATERVWNVQLLYRDEHGETWIESAGDPAARLDRLGQRRGIGIDYVVDLALTAAEATELQRLLYAALERFERGGSGREGTRGYVLSVALYPREEP